MKATVRKPLGRLLMLATMLWATGASATPLVWVEFSLDIAVNAGGVELSGDDVARDPLDGSGTAPVSIGPSVKGSSVQAYHRERGGDRFFSLETTVAFPGFTARPRDVVRFDGSSYSLEFDGGAAGIPAGVSIDALTSDAGNLLLSLDVTTALGPLTVDDADLVRWNGSAFTLFFNASAAGVLTGLDLDAAHHVESVGNLLLSFDGSGEIGGVSFADEDVLEYDPLLDSWQLAYDPLPTASAIDLDALSAEPDADSDGLGDSVETNTGVYVDSGDTGTDPLLFDSDGDGFGDGEEVASGSDPTDIASVPGLQPPVVEVPGLGGPQLGILALLLAAAAVHGSRRTP